MGAASAARPHASIVICADLWNWGDMKKKILLVLPEKTDKLQKAVRNVEGVTFVLANQLNTYEVLNTRTLLLMKSAVITLEKTFGGEK